jgi:hypothetical protein
MATLAEALKDKKGFPDDTKFTSASGFETTLGELRAFQDATGQDVAKQLADERTKLEAEQQAVAKAQEEVVNLWTKLQEAAGKPPAKAAAEGTDWRKDPFFQPIAEYLDRDVMAKITELSNNYSQVQKALGLGVKYITDVISEQRYAMLPEDFRKEVGYDVAVKTAADKKYLDAGGVPDVRKVHEAWQMPRERDAEKKKIEDAAYARARQELMSNSLARPSGLPTGAVPQADPNAPKNIRESFQRLKEDPEFLAQIYNLTGQA